MEHSNKQETDESAKKEDANNFKLHEILKNKGDYLFFQYNKLFLMENNIPKEVKFLSLKSSENWDDINFGDEYYILSFDLKENDLNEAIGSKISSFLNKLKKQNVKFRISRALPRSIFGSKHIAAFNEFGIPKSCKDCLELYKISSRGNTRLCNGNILKGFRLTNEGRHQIYRYLKILFGEKAIINDKNRRFDFRLIERLNCTDPKRETTNELIKFDFIAYWISKMGWNPGRIAYAGLEHENVLSKGVILDNGGAHGRDTFLIKEWGFDVVLTDIKSVFLKYAKQRQSETGIYFPIIASDSRKLPFKDQSFSGVLSGGVMHHNMHIEDVKEYLEESYRVLMPGGIFFGHMWAYWDFGAPTEPHLLQIKDKAKFKSLLEEAGFKIIGSITEETYTPEPHKHNWVFACNKP